MIGKTKTERELIIMEECLKMLRLTKKNAVLHEATKNFVKDKLKNNDLFNEVIEKSAKEN